MGRGPGSAMVVRTIATVPAQDVAGMTWSSAMTDSSASCRQTASLWGLLGCLSVTSQLAQCCEVIVSTKCTALLTFGWTLGVGMRVITLLTVIFGGYGQGIHM